MKLYKDVYQVKTTCRVQLELWPFDCFMLILCVIFQVMPLGFVFPFPPKIIVLPITW